MTYIFFLKSTNVYGLNQPRILIQMSQLNLLKSGHSYCAFKWTDDRQKPTPMYRGRYVKLYIATLIRKSEQFLGFLKPAIQKKVLVGSLIRYAY
jgi:hypothetical protein